MNERVLISRTFLEDLKFLLARPETKIGARYVLISAIENALQAANSEQLTSASEPEEGYCACALVSGFPVECYQPTDALIAKSAPAEPISREAVGWLCTHSDGRKRIELPGSVYDQDAGWGASRVPLYTAPPSPDAECERLLDLLADWSSHFTGPKVIGGPLSSLRERTDAALLNGGRSCIRHIPRRKRSMANNEFRSTGRTVRRAAQFLQQALAKQGDWVTMSLSMWI